MKRLTIEFYKNSRKGGGKILTKAIQEIDVTTGTAPKHEAFFDPDFGKLFLGFFNAEGYLLAFIDENMKFWNQSRPGLLCSLSFNEDDFIGNELDVVKLMKKMTSAKGAIPKSVREQALLIKGLNKGSKSGDVLISTYKGKAI